MLLKRSFAIALLVILSGGLGVGKLAAQRPPPVHVLGLILDDSTDEPIPGADVLILDAFGERLATRVTDDFGRFEIEVRWTPGIQIRAGRIGFREATSPVLRFEGRLRYSIELRLDAEVVLLAPLEVVARSRTTRSALFANFDRRVDSGFGSYFTREDIERIRPMRVSDLLGRVPGVSLEGSGSGMSRVVRMSRALPGQGGGRCAAQIWVDGMLMNRGGLLEVAIDDFVSPNDVEGVEIYPGLSTVPAEFLNPSARCGVVAVWTRRAG